jgi:hypothetical protein
MPNRATRRAAERLALKAAKHQQRDHQAQAQPLTMAAAAGAASAASPICPNVDFAPEDTTTSPTQPRPVSDAQRAANRANAQKSTGPVTPEGRAKSSLNAVKTGLTGQTVLLPSDDVAAYEAHVQQHIADYSPVTAQERNLVQRIADAEWRINRIAPLEASIYAIGRIKLAHLHPEETDPAVRETLIQGEIFLAYRRDLNNLALQDRRLRNQQKTDIAQLRALQQERQDANKQKTDTQAKMLTAIGIMWDSKKINMPFDPAYFGFEFSLPEIEHCYQAMSAAAERQEPIPSVADLLARFRNTQKEAA